MKSLTAVQRVALSKLDVQFDEARSKVLPGVHEVDFTVRVHGSLKVSVDHDATPQTPVPLLAAVAFASTKLGIPREVFIETIRASLLTAFAVPAEARNQAIKDSGLLYIEEEFRKNVVAKLPKKPVRGAVYAAVICDRID